MPDRPMPENPAPLLFNKPLGITEEDVLYENELPRLAEWKDSLNEQIRKIKVRLLELEDARSRDPENGRVPYIRACTAKRRMVELTARIDSRIRVLRENEKKQVLLMRKFMKVAKTRLSRETYADILQEAKMLSGIFEDPE